MITTAGWHDYKEVYDLSEPLGEPDLVWLSHLAHRQLDQTDAAEAQELIAPGTLDLRLVPHNSELYAEGLKARQAFFGDILGWDNKENPEHRTYETIRTWKPTLIPLGHFVDLQRLLCQENIDSLRIMHANPRITGQSSVILHERLEVFRRNKLEPSALINAAPRLMGMAAPRLQAAIDHMASLGLDPVRLLHTKPEMLGSNKESTQIKAYTLMRLGILSTERELSDKDAARVAALWSESIERTQIAAAQLVNTPEPTIQSLHHVIHATRQYLKTTEAVQAHYRANFADLQQRLGWVATAQGLRNGTLEP